MAKKDTIHVSIVSELPKYISRITGEIAFEVAATLRRNCQVDTGFLLSTLGVQFTQYDEESQMLYLTILAAYYAGMVKPKGGGRRGQWLTNARRDYTGEGKIIRLSVERSGEITVAVRISDSLVFGNKKPVESGGLFEFVNSLIRSRPRRKRRTR